MALGDAPECSQCKATESMIWERGPKEEILCSSCFNSTQGQNDKDADQERKNESKVSVVDKKEQESNGQNRTTREDDENDDKDTNKNSEKREYRRKTRKGKYGGKNNIPKGKGRRYIFKKSVTKSPVAVSTPVTSDYVFYQGMYYQVGDIVSVVDVEGGLYYAQIRGLLQDQFCEKSAVITWLLPSKKSPPPEEKFDPSTYIIGPEEDVPRKLEHFRFVCHAPSNYFMDKTSPYPTFNSEPESCFVWSKFGPVIRPIESAKEIMTK